MGRGRARADDPAPCRRTFASLVSAAGVNAKALSTYTGHSTIAVTLDLYGHRMPGSEAEAAGLLDAYLAAQREQAEDRARAADPLTWGRADTEASPLCWTMGGVGRRTWLYGTVSGV